MGENFYYKDHNIFNLKKFYQSSPEIYYYNQTWEVKSENNRIFIKKDDINKDTELNDQQRRYDSNKYDLNCSNTFRNDLKPDTFYISNDDTEFTNSL